MHYVDHSLVILIAVVYPIASFIGFRRLLRRVAAGETVKRTDLYRNTMISHWTLLFITMALWAYADRAWTDIGFGLDFNLWFGVGVILTTLGTSQWTHFLESNYANTTASQIVHTINLARSEAIKRNQTITISGFTSRSSFEC